jgi:hypothetical protein
MKKKSPQKSSRKPVAVGMLVGMAAAAAAIWALTTYWPRRVPDAIAEPAAQSIPVPPELPRGFSTLEGPPPGADTPYKGTLVAWVRWNDDTGEHMVILSSVPPSLEALHYRRAAAGFELLSEHSAQPAGSAPEARAAFFRDGIRAVDSDGDGLGEAMFAYYIDEDPAPGPKTLTLITFTGNRTLSIQGNTRFDPADGTSAAPVTRPDDAMLVASAPLRAAALELWAEAQFDLAEPPAYADFFPHRRFTGATFSGDDPFWTLAVLPQYLLLKLATEEKAAVIRYESIRAEGQTLVIEGKGEIEAWSHGFRVTLVETPVTAPHGEVFPFSATVDWSDGTRLSGWGNLAVDPTIDLTKQDAP